MDEVDNIIVHSLEQIGCSLYIEPNDDHADEECGSDEVFRLRYFTPTLLIQTVSKCLKEINPYPDEKRKKNVSTHILPENMAQRFTVASDLAEMCKSIGYQLDIGYQTFLYPNEIETRRLLMFLVEHLPKHSKDGHRHDGSGHHGIVDGSLSILLRRAKQNISKELKTSWTPQCVKSSLLPAIKPISIVSATAPSLSLSANHGPINVPFRPQLIYTQTYATDSKHKQGRSLKQLNHLHLISTLLHRNALDIHVKSDSGKKLNLLTVMSRLCLSTTDYNLSNKTTSATSPSPLQDLSNNQSNLQYSATVYYNDSAVPSQEQIIEQIDLLKAQHIKFNEERRNTFSQLDSIQETSKKTTEFIEELGQELRNHQRICAIIENVDENQIKLEALIEKTRKRRIALESQWGTLRSPAINRLEELRTLKQTKNLQIIEELRDKIQLLKNILNEKNTRYMKLITELKNSGVCRINAVDGNTTTPIILLRHDYTQRIHEFICNIRKQRKDIHRILDDTKELQKHLNTLEGRLQRQFNYTDDILFQSAKHNTYAKQAYKILATLHENCNDIYQLIDQTGQTVKDIREHELQIDREYAKNLDGNLKQISSDINKIQNCIQIMTNEIENVYQQ